MKDLWVPEVFLELTWCRVRDVSTPMYFNFGRERERKVCTGNLFNSSLLVFYRAGLWAHRMRDHRSWLDPLSTHDALLRLSSRILWPLNISVKDSRSCNYLLYRELGLPLQFSFSKFILRFAVDSTLTWLRAYLTSFYFQNRTCRVANFL